MNTSLSATTAAAGNGANTPSCARPSLGGGPALRPACLKCGGPTIKKGTHSRASGVRVQQYGCGPCQYVFSHPAERRARPKRLPWEIPVRPRTEARHSQRAKKKSVADPEHEAKREAKGIFGLVNRGIETIESARALIAMTPTQRKTLEKLLPATQAAIIARASLYREVVAQHFERLLARSC
jgi:hypothetical protein